MKDMTGQAAVVTGGASGIGFGMVRAFLDRGARVAMVDINEHALRESTDELGLAAEQVIAIQADVSDADDVARVRREAESAFGRVDIACANAGLGSRERAIWDIPVAEWRWVFDINVFHIVNMAHEFIPPMLARDHGHFVSTASMQGITTGRVGPYASSKAAAASLTECIFADLRRAESRVGVSCLCPSYTKNSMVDHPERRRWFPGSEPSPEEEAKLAVVAGKLRERGLEARQVGDMVADAVGTDTFWITPTPGSLERVSRRAEEIVGGLVPSIATT